MHCSLCFCYCDDEKISDRYFSLREALSDITENKLFSSLHDANNRSVSHSVPHSRVVTGLRLVKENRIIHFEILERTIRKNGVVDNDPSVRWQRGTGNRFPGNEQVDKGYFTLTWQKRAIELDTVYVPSDHVVTGVRFREVDGRLRFEVRSTKYNTADGTLSSHGTIWHRNSNRNKRRISVENADVPTRSRQHSDRLKGSDYFVEFTQTGIYEDVAQSTGDILANSRKCFRVELI